MAARRCWIAVFSMLALAVPAGAGADVVTGRQPAWVPDGEVQAVTVSGSTAYLGGNFSRIAPYTGSSARFDPANGQLKGPWPEVEGVVNAIEPDDAGGWFLGGDFKSVGGVLRTDLAHVLADGSVDPNWAPTTNGTVRALAVAPGVIYAGGDFSEKNGTSGLGDDLAGFDRATGALTGFSGSLALGSPDFAGAHALLLIGNTLYVGGEFGAPLVNGAAFRVTDSALLNWEPNPNGRITSLGTSGSDVFIAGPGISEAGGQPRPGVAKVNPTTGAADGLWVPPLVPGAIVRGMTVSGGSVYLGGSNMKFSPSDPPREGVALSVNGAVPSSWNPDVPGGITSVKAAGATVYIGGAEGGQSRLSAVNAANGTTIPSFAPLMGRGRLRLQSETQTGVRAIGVGASDVIAGGTFINVGGVERRNLAAIDLNTGQATAFNPPTNSPSSDLERVDALVLADGLVWAGGTFSTEDPNPRSGLAAFDPDSGAIATFNRSAPGVFALAASGSTVFVGGSFTSVGSTPRRRVAAVRHVPGDIGTVLAFDADVNGPVRALAVGGDSLYLGGQFQNLNGGVATRRNLAAVDPTSGVARAWKPDADGPVDALADDGATVFAGGDFATVNDSTPRQRLAAFDAQSGAARDWAPGADGPVQALVLYGSTLFAGGEFATAGSAPRRGLAALDAQTGAPDPFTADLAPEERNGPNSPVTRVGALAVSPNPHLLAGGTFVMRSPAPPSANLSGFELSALPGPATPGGGGDNGDGGGGGGSNDGGGAPPGGTVLPVDGINPNLALTASRRRFRVGRGATSTNGTATTAGRRRRRTPAGTTIRLGLSEPAGVRFDVLARTAGRRVGRRCVKPTRRNRTRRRCTRLVRRGTFTRSAPAGQSRIAWSGRLGRRALKPGRYVVRATPTDAAGNRGAARSLSVTIVR